MVCIYLWKVGTHVCDLHNILNDGDSSIDNDDELIEGKEGIIDVGDILAINTNEFTMEGVGRFNGNPRSDVPMEKTLFRLGLTMKKITKE
jgi:hypothetical protein